MKLKYEKPIIATEEFVIGQYCASTCGKHVGIPEHGHFKNSAGETHCAFTSSNCGDNALECCEEFDSKKHQTITFENGTVINRPISDYHNCHVLSTNDAAKAFVKTYKDEKCGDGVAALLDVGSFEEITIAFS